MAHTPGPWERREIREMIAIAQSGSMPHATVFNRGTGEALSEEAQANATLIAASPDLRRFAQEIAALDPQDFDAHMGETLIRRARALVVKADGAT